MKKTYDLEAIMIAHELCFRTSRAEFMRTMYHAAMMGLIGTMWNN